MLSISKKKKPLKILEKPVFFLKNILKLQYKEIMA